MNLSYKKPLQAENWHRALWYFTVASHPLNLEGQLGKISIPVLVMARDDDWTIPTNQSLRLAQGIPSAQLAVVSNCGHIPHKEQSQIFMDRLVAFLNV